MATPPGTQDAERLDSRFTDDGADAGKGCSPEWPRRSMKATGSSPRCRWCRWRAQRILRIDKGSDPVVQGLSRSREEGGAQCFDVLVAEAGSSFCV